MSKIDIVNYLTEEYILFIQVKIDALKVIYLLSDVLVEAGNNVNYKECVINQILYTNKTIKGEIILQNSIKNFDLIDEISSGMKTATNNIEAIMSGDDIILKTTITKKRS